VFQVRSVRRSRAWGASTITRAPVVLLLLFVTACASPVQHNTPSGRPEVTIQNGDPNQIRGFLTNHMLNIGYRMTEDGANRLVFERDVENTWGAMLLGSRYDPTPAARVTYTLASTGSAIRVIADFAVVTNDGSAFERTTSLNNNVDTVQFQDMLNQMRNQMSSAPVGGVK